MDWRLANSLEILRKQVNDLSPNRSKASDGTIGDAAHATRASDHNPWIIDGGVGIVTALDLTHDPAHGIDCDVLAGELLLNRDERIKYVIWDRKIFSSIESPWKWRAYSGSNPHTKHLHISVRPEKKFYDNNARWALALRPSQAQIEAAPGRPDPLLVRGARGEFVAEAQDLLNRHGAGLQVDGIFGSRTESATRVFQSFSDLVADGKIGPYTWEKLRE